MELNELRKSMSTLEQVLAKTDADISINVSASETAKSKILRKLRQGVVANLVLAAVFTAAAIANINPLSFPLCLKVYLASFLAMAAVWYVFIYRKLNRIDVAALPPAKLFARTASLKLMVISGEIFFGVCLVVLFTLLFQNAWMYNRFGFWAMAIGLSIVLVISVVYYWPKYICLFRELNSIR